MALFNNAIQTLSEMAIQENGVDLPQVTAPAIIDELKATLELMPSLNEAEMQYGAMAVPIKESPRLNKYLIEMEDLSRYMITNGVSSIVEAVKNILETNGIGDEFNKVALVIDEASILNEMDDLGFDIPGTNVTDGNLGTHGMIGKHLDIQKFRRFANSKEIIDTITNRYGIPVVKKNYSVGIMKESTEATKLKTSETDTVLQEKPYQKGDKTTVNESTEPEVLDEHAAYIQKLKDIASGKFDNEL